MSLNPVVITLNSKGTHRTIGHLYEVGLRSEDLKNPDNYRKQDLPNPIPIRITFEDGKFVAVGYATGWVNSNCTKRFAWALRKAIAEKIEALEIGFEEDEKEEEYPF